MSVNEEAPSIFFSKIDVINPSTLNVSVKSALIESFSLLSIVRAIPITFLPCCFNCNESSYPIPLEAPVKMMMSTSYSPSV